MSNCCGGHKMCMGLLLLVLGVLFLLGTMGVWPEFTFVKYWPVALIVVGLHKMFCPSKMCDMKEMKGGEHMHGGGCCK